MSANPLDQFKIHPLADWSQLELGGYDVSFTNSSLWMVISIALTSAFMIMGMRKKAVIPGRWQAAVEYIYEAVAGIVRENAGEKARPFFPFIFTLFMIILMGNLLGMLPYSFTYTSHIVVTFALAVIVFGACVLVGLFKHGFKFFTLFIPKGLPLPIVPLIFVIELFSFCFRPISLSIRLFANMLAGHIALKIFAGLVVMAGYFGLFPFAITTAMVGFEVFVAVLQAYIFALLASVYLHDSIYLH